MTVEPPESLTDMPERGSPAEELEYRLRQQQLTTEYALLALTTYDVQTLLQEASSICAKGLHSTLCKVMEYLPERDRFIVRAGVGWKAGIVGRATTGADEKSPTGYAFKTGEAIISNHFEGETRFRTPAILAEHGVKRAINAPILCGGERLGVLEVDSPVRGRFTDADLVFVEGFANLLGVALHRQRIDEELQRNEALLKQALQHQKMLADEIGHRVKNSLAIVAGLLNMQGRASADPRLKQALSDAQARVQAIAKVHDRLSRNEEIGAVNIAEFLNALCEDLRASAPNHDLVCEVAPVMMTTAQAISLGLLTNELVTNALKYAYPGGSGLVSLSLLHTGTDRLRMEISDRGVGLPAGNGLPSSGGLGRKVIETLIRHLEAEVEWQDAKPGTRFVLTLRSDIPASQEDFPA